jgi:hypothetical protein
MAIFTVSFRKPRLSCFYRNAFDHNIYVTMCGSAAVVSKEYRTKRRTSGRNEEVAGRFKNLYNESKVKFI